MKIRFYGPKKRNNTFKKKSYEYALDCALDDGRPWTITTFDYQPNDVILTFIKDIVIRSMEFYYRSIIWPSFELVEVDDD